MADYILPTWLLFRPAFELQLLKDHAAMASTVSAALIAESEGADDIEVAECAHPGVGEEAPPGYSAAAAVRPFKESLTV